MDEEPGKHSVWTRVRQVAEVNPGAPAIVEPHGNSCDFATLAGWMDSLTALLRRRGYGVQDTIAVVLPDGAAGLVTILALTEVCGCAPLNSALTTVELTSELTELGARALICQPGLQVGLQLGEELGLGVIHVASDAGRCTWSVAKEAQDGVGFSNEGAALLLHTSGTTAGRKVVPLTRENLMAGAAASVRSLRLSGDDRLLLMARLFHAQAILSALAQWSAGGAVVATGPVEVARFQDRLEALRPTWYTCGPAVHRAILVELRGCPLANGHTLRLVRSGGSALAPELKRELQQVLGVPVLEMYGLSETGLVAATDLDDPDGGMRGMGLEIEIRDERGEALRSGEEGEIVVRGATVMRGYLREEEATREAFWSRPGTQGEWDRWFRTGDLGVLNAKGTLTIRGRLKELINRGGQKVDPAEVDEALGQHPAVHKSAAFGWPHQTLGEEVVCAVVLREGELATEDEIRSFARKSLARFKVPRRVYFVREIPQGATGKTQRFALRQRLMASAAPGREATPVACERRLNDVDGALKQIWMRRLGSSHAGPQDDFFGLGGDSLEAESMLAEVEAMLGVRLADDARERFFEKPRLVTLAEIIAMPVDAEARRSQAIRAIPLLGDGSRHGPGTKAFLLPADGDEGLYFRLLSRHMLKDRGMWVVRPENSWHIQRLDMLDRAVRDSMAAIRGVKPAGPYLIGGFCQGGAFAYETARRLEESGEQVLLVLFDAPMPGSPHPVYEWSRYADTLPEMLRCAWRTADWRPAARFVKRLARLGLWLGLRRLKGPLAGRAEGPLVRWLRREAQERYFPLYRAARTRMPILHFVETAREGTMRGLSVEGWHRVTDAGMTKVLLPGGERTLFAEVNLAKMAETVRAWEQEQLTGTGAVDLRQVS